VYKRQLLDEAINADVVHAWCHGFDSEDGHPRYACRGGMTSLAKWMAADLIESGDLRLATRISALDHDGSVWQLADDDGVVAEAKAIIITAPVPQTLDLFASSNIELDDATANDLAAITYKPVLGLLVTLETCPAIPSPGAIQATEDDHFTFIADNVAKGVSTSPAVTFHANGAVSAERWDDPEGEVVRDFLAKAQPWIGDATIREIELKRWRYAAPHTPYPDRSVTATTSPGHIVLGGDAFGGPKVEGAFNSGHACAQSILASEAEAS